MKNAIYILFTSMLLVSCSQKSENSAISSSDILNIQEASNTQEMIKGIESENPFPSDGRYDGVWLHAIREPFKGPGGNTFLVEFNQNVFSVDCSNDGKVSFDLFTNGRTYTHIYLIIDGVTIKFPNNHKGRLATIISKLENAKTLQVVYGQGTISVPVPTPVDKKEDGIMYRSCVHGLST